MHQVRVGVCERALLHRIMPESAKDGSNAGKQKNIKGSLSASFKLSNWMWDKLWWLSMWLNCLFKYL